MNVVRMHNSSKELPLKFYQDVNMKACDEITHRFKQNGIQNYLEMEIFVLNSNLTTTKEPYLALQALCKKY